MAKRKVQSQINLERLAGGAFAEKLNEALMQVAENIQNPNTEATTKRQINIAIKFAPNKSRQVINPQTSVTTKLAATPTSQRKIHSRRSPPGSRRKLRQRPSGSRTFQPALLLI